MSEIELVQSSVVDGRAENGRYRQDQLQSLHKKLREEAGEICSALLADAKSSIAEAETEYYLTMDAVRNFYDSLDFKKDLEDEYLVAHGKDNADRRVGAGLVVIRPTTHTRFYSIVTPLAAAIAAGNCVILEVGDSLNLVFLVSFSFFYEERLFTNLADPASGYPAASGLCAATTPHQGFEPKHLLYLQVRLGPVCFGLGRPGRPDRPRFFENTDNTAPLFNRCSLSCDC